MDSPGSVYPALEALEPICGGALALNLAYLNLHRFRYQARLRQEASQRIESEQAVPPAMRSKVWFEQTRKLADLGLSETRLLRFGKINWKMPEGLWPKLLYLFHWNVDRIFCLFMVVLSSVILVCGVAKQIEIFWLIIIFNAAGVSFWFFISLITFLTPVIFIIFGHHVVTGGARWMAGRFDDVASEVKTSASSNVEATFQRINQINQQKLAEESGRSKQP